MLRSRPPVDSAAEAMEWTEQMEGLAERRRTGRFKRDPHAPPTAPHHVVKR
ncbi:MAG TPA: hypothetical protein VD790_06210 [Thermoleophilaceae bacterium]|nr:hypothetical protein [Thermoleophilaceae bacterium]